MEKVAFGGLTVFVFLIFNSISLKGQTPTLNKVYTSFELPVHMATNNEDLGIYILELGGDIEYIPDLEKDSSVSAGTLVKVSRNGESGAYGMAFHPSYPDSPYVYIHYVYDTTYVTVRLSRFTFANQTLDSLSEHVIYTEDNVNNLHHGGNPVFGDDGMLYFPKGDGERNLSVSSNGQDPDTMKGSVIRIDINGDDFPMDSLRNYSIPPDNPFVDSVGYKPEIYAIGIRNPWKMTKDRDSSLMYFGDVGKNAYEEINNLRKGGNYGWGCYEGLDSTDVPCLGGVDTALIAPLFAGIHDEFGSITGGYVYRGDSIPGWNGMYFFGDFSTNKLCMLDTSGVHCWDKSNSDFDVSIVTFGEDRGGNLYVASLFSGDIYRIDTLVFNCDSMFVDTLNLAYLYDERYTALELIISDTLVYQSTQFVSPKTQVYEGFEVSPYTIFSVLISDKEAICRRRKYGIPY